MNHMHYMLHYYKKENNGELYFQFYYLDKEKAELCKLKQNVVLELCRMFTS